MNSPKYANFMPTLCQLMHAVSGIERCRTLTKNNPFKKMVNRKTTLLEKALTENLSFEKKALAKKP
jgi:hypothetical protein